jgi:hypothetical protein
MIISVFAIIGAFCVTLIGVVLFIALSRLLIALFIDTLILKRYSFFRFPIAHRDTSGNTQNKEYKFHPVHYIVDSFQFLNRPLCFFCKWFQKPTVINCRRSAKDTEAREQNYIDRSPEATSHINSLTRGSVNGQPKANTTVTA